jgi:hypothetical protein
MRVMIIGVIAGAAVLTGCSSAGRCMRAQSYQSAVTLPTPGSIPGLTVPDSATALRIPPPPANAEPYGRVEKTSDGGTRYVCLDEPPRMSATPGDAPVTETVPAPPAPPES